MLCTRTCLKGAVVVGLIAALTPVLAAVAAEPLQQRERVTPPVRPVGNDVSITRTPTPGGRVIMYDAGNGGEDAGGCGDPAAGSCFVVHPTPFCDDAACCATVCAIDSFCCEVAWDSLCVDEAQELCAGCGDPDAGSCFVANGTPGCNNAQCCAIVCDADPFCCKVAWDSLCVDEAQELCAGCGDPAAGSCFEANGTPGCDDAECCALVCDLDPFCCKVEWDGQCAGEAEDLCGGAPPENDLCENAIPVPVPGSVVGFTNDATFDDFPFCGTSNTAPGIWYTVIGTGARITATTCSEFSEYDTKISVYCVSCDEPLCVTGNDDDCDGFNFLLSTVNWCSQEGAKYLILVHGFGGQTGGFELILFDDGVACDDPVDCAGGECGDADAGSCFENNGTPFCDDVLCCLVVCAIDPFCCEEAWDQICADEATKFCDFVGPGFLDQPPNQVNGIFSDVDCDFCNNGVQILAENFNVGEDLSIGTVRIFGGYFPDNLAPVDAFTVNFHEDDAGFPGVIIDSQTRSATHTLTGVELFGVQEYQIDIEIVALSLTSGTYWVSVYNDTSPHTDSFFWETGNLDPDHGKPGGAFRFDLPGPGGWNFDPKQELATTLLPPDPCPWDLDDGGFVGAGDLLLLLADWGNPYGAVDLLALLADWGACP